MNTSKSNLFFGLLFFAGIMGLLLLLIYSIVYRPIDTRETAHKNAKTYIDTHDCKKGMHIDQRYSFDEYTNKVTTTPGFTIYNCENPKLYVSIEDGR